MSESKIEILQGKVLDKGSLYAKMTIYVREWDFVIREVLAFKKGSEIWFNFPSKKFEDEDGQEGYMAYCKFSQPKNHAAFQKILREAFHEWLGKQMVVNV